jgi:hypothetical protein
MRFGISLRPYFSGRYLEIDDGGSERRLGELRRVIDGVAVQYDEL